MLSLPPSVRVFLAVGATDMRKSFDGLSGLVRSAIGSDPLSGHLFAFCNRDRNRMKVLYWDTSGFVLLHSTRSAPPVLTTPESRRSKPSTSARARPSSRAV